MPGATALEDFIFRFISPTAAKEEKEAVIGFLSDIITSLKKAAAQKEAPAQSSAISTPLASGGNAQEVKEHFADSAYLNDIQLQRALLTQDPVLHQRFQEALTEMLKDNPKTSLNQFSLQFWSSRIHLLRSFAVEKAQAQGPYHVLSQIKKSQDEQRVIRINLSKDQIALIFKQHPIVRRIYNSLVPGMNDMTFWTSFFRSKLFKKLKGERISEDDASVPEIDRFLNEEGSLDSAAQFQVRKIPRFLDLDGNEQDHTESLGNAPDIQMRPSRHEKVPILRALNSMSEKMMANVIASDAKELYGPAGTDEATFEQLQLKDLGAQDEDSRVHLKVASQHKFFSGESQRNENQIQAVDPDKVLDQLRAELGSETDLVIAMNENSTLQISKATKDMLKTIKQRGTNLKNTQIGALPAQAVQSATMTHNTSIEFLHYFWDIYLSGDESRAGELQTLAETLNKSLERMEAVANEAEDKRQAELTRLRERQLELARATGKRRRPNEKLAGGGKNEVLAMLASTGKAIKFAEAEYQKTYNEQISQSTVV